jgi:hypothetical protein
LNAGACSASSVVKTGRTSSLWSRACRNQFSVILVAGAGEINLCHEDVRYLAFPWDGSSVITVDDVIGELVDGLRAEAI